jgi:hypothetical protein
MVESVTVIVPALVIPPPYELPPVTVTLSSVTGKLALLVRMRVVLLPPPLSTVAAEEPDPVPVPSMVRLASLPLLTKKFPSKVQGLVVVHVPPESETSLMVTASPLKIESAMLIA